MTTKAEFKAECLKMIEAAFEHEDLDVFLVVRVGANWEKRAAASHTEPMLVELLKSQHNFIEDLMHGQKMTFRGEFDE